MASLCESLKDTEGQVACKYYIGLICASIWAVFLPSVNQSVYFHQKNVNQSSATLNKESDSNVEKRVPVKQAVQHLWSDFKAAFTHPYVIKWALWWALSTCGYWQVVNYTQLLWQTIRKDNGDFEPPFYGIVEAAYTLLGAMASMTMGKVRLDWAVVGEPLLAVCSVVVAGVLYLSSATLSIVLAYSTYIAFTVIYHTMITVANSEVAKHVNRDSYGLVFGVTTFVALLLQTGLTYVVNRVFRLPARTQFVVYGGYFAVLGACFLSVTLVRIISRTRRRPVQT